MLARIWHYIRHNYLNFAVIMACLIVVFSVVLVLFSEVHALSNLNQRLGNVANVLVYLSTVYAALAFIIAVLAYRAAVRHPRLRVLIHPWKGELDNLQLAITEDYKVDFPMPLTNWKVLIENYGSVTAKFPVVQLEFDGLYFGEERFEGWDKVLHAHSLGWYGIRWSPGSDVVVHPNFPLELPPLYFSGMFVGHKDGGAKTSIGLTITVAADGFEPFSETRTVNLIAR